MTRYSILSLVRNGLGGNRSWPRAWRSPEPRPAYDVVVVGAGGHGLATAYYLAREHGVTDVLVLDKGRLGGGNTGRNTTVVRSNYLWPEAARFYEHSLKLWEGLSQALNFNVMFSQRGVVALAHSRQGLIALRQRSQANRALGIDSEMLDLDGLRRWLPHLNTARDIRFPVYGGAVQPRAGTARHDAVAWGYARAADALGVDIVENCAVTGFLIRNGSVEGVETARGPIRAKRVAIAAAGHSSVLAARAGVRLPIVSYPLQAMVSEPLKPVLDTVINSTVVHVYMSQSDKGELVLGASRDSYPSYAQRGGFQIIEDAVAAMLELYPILGRVRLMRTWAGIVDVTPDTSPIIDRLPVRNLFINGGWGTGGFKATPGSGQLFAELIASDRRHPLIRPFSLARFESGRLVDESAAAGVGH